MKELPMRLNQIVNPSEIKRKYIAETHNLNKCLQRNKLFSTASHGHSTTYECQLPKMAFAKKDLSKVLRCLLNKAQMSMADRNLLRRILVSYFEQDFICAGSRYFIQHLKVQERQKQTCEVSPKQRLFYLIIRGQVTVRSGDFTYSVEAGGMFGHFQILAQTNIQFISYKESTLMLTLAEIYFNNYFRHYFQKIYEPKFQQLACIRQAYLDSLPELNKYLLVDKMQSRLLKLGDVITKKGSPFERIYFISSLWKEQRPITMIHGCLGLHQYLKQKVCYSEDVFCPEEALLVSSVCKHVFHLYVGRYILKKDISNREERQIAKTKEKAYTQASSPQKTRDQLNLMRIKRVKLLYPASIKMKCRQSMIANFRFFNTGDVQINQMKKEPQRRRNSLMDDSKHQHVI